LPLICLVLVGLCPDDTVALRPHWKVGEVVRYEMSKSVEKRKGEKVLQQGSSQTDYTFEVLEATEGGYLLKASVGQVHVTEPEHRANPLVREMARLVEGLDLMIEVDRGGSFLGVRNWKEVQEILRKVTEACIRRLGEEGVDEETRGLLRRQMGSMCASKQQVEMSCTREIQFLFATLGLTHDRASPVEYDVILPNPLGGDPFPARATYALKELAGGRARVVFDQTIPPDEARRILEKTLEDLARRLGRELPEGEFPDSIAIDDHGEFWVDTGTGWLRSVSWKRTSKIGDQARIDTVEIRRKGD
jgi:hypothetical protein